MVHRRTDSVGRSISFHYDTYSRLTTLTNENGEHYQFTYDAGDRLHREVLRSQGQLNTEFKYDRNSPAYNTNKPGVATTLFCPTSSPIAATSTTTSTDW
ncbi:hypothetical protein [Snodgrassella sp. CS2]|uniref:hypothetical protein n=1 Tax=Snodgrassella sp. CS2 TaxID=3418953 RepID=UPI003D05108F